MFKSREGKIMKCRRVVWVFWCRTYFKDCESELRYSILPAGILSFIVTHGGAYQCPELDCRWPVFDGSDALR